MNQTISQILSMAFVSTICIFLIIITILYLLRHKVKAFDKFLNSLVSKNKHPMTCSNPEVIKELLPIIKTLSLQDRLVLIQALMQRDCKVMIGIDDQHFWIEGLHGIDFVNKE